MSARLGASASILEAPWKVEAARGQALEPQLDGRSIIAAALDDVSRRYLHIRKLVKNRRQIGVDTAEHVYYGR